MVDHLLARPPTTRLPVVLNLRLPSRTNTPAICNLPPHQSPLLVALCIVALLFLSFPLLSNKPSVLVILLPSHPSPCYPPLQHSPPKLYSSFFCITPTWLHPASAKNKFAYWLHCREVYETCFFCSFYLALAANKLLLLYFPVLSDKST